MPIQKSSPPVLAKALFIFLTRYEEDHALSGDCGEEFAERMQGNGRLCAVFWYWGQVFYALGAYIKLSAVIGAAMLKNYLIVTWRNFRNHKVYSFINVMGLAVGMTCCILILLWVQDELSFDGFHEKYDDIYYTIPELGGTRYYANPLALAPLLKEKHPEVIRMARFGSRTWLTKSGDKLFNERGALVDEDFLKIFSFPLVTGDQESVLAGRNSIVISERMAAKFFGSEEPIGRSVLINNSTELIVTGVLENVPANSHLQFDFLAPISLQGGREQTSWSWEVRTYLLLQKNTDWKAFEKRISGFVNEHDKRTQQEVILHLHPLSRMHLYAINGTNPIIYVYIFLTIAVAIMIIACINFINLTTARSNTRAKEIGLRKVVGAEKAHIIRQFMGESIIMSLLALLLAVGFVSLLLPAFNALAEKQLSLQVVGNVSSILILGGIALFTGLLSGSYPALLLSSLRPTRTLKGEYQAGIGGYVLRKVLVVSQFTATIVLMIGTILMYKQLNYIRNKDIGLERDRVVAVSMNNELRENYKALKEKIKQNPQILNVTAARRIPTNIGHMNPVYWEGRGPEDYVTMTDACVEYDYFKTMGMTILQGRAFSEEFATDQENYVLTEQAARITQLESPLGKMFSIWEDEGKIIGIVKDFHSRSLHREIGPVVFTMSQRHGRYAYIFVKLRPENVAASLKYLEQNVREFSPNGLFEYQFLDDAFDGQYRSDQRRGSIYQYFSILAVFISCLGLFGMASFTAEQRTKEIGIRKVVGASIRQIVMLISKDFLMLLLVSNLIAWPIAYILMSRLLNSYAYRTGISLWVFIVSGAAAILIALLSVSIRIAKAAYADPINSIRYE
jgi:predicted permease